MVGNFHDDLVILTTTFDHELILRSIMQSNLTTIAGLKVVFESIAQHESILANVQLDSVTSVCLGTELSEGLRLGVGEGDHGLLC